MPLNFKRHHTSFIIKSGSDTADPKFGRFSVIFISASMVDLTVT
jgi:hypothetical protein